MPSSASSLARAPLLTRPVSAPGITLIQRQCQLCGWWTSFPTLLTSQGHACVGCIPSLPYRLIANGVAGRA